MNNILPSDAKERKEIPLASGVLDYFTQALIEVAKVSYEGNKQHNPGEPLHWARGKSQDQADTMLRHFTERGTLDTDGMRHSAKMCWRALAILQLELEAEGYPIARGAQIKTPPVVEGEIRLPPEKFVKTTRTVSNTSSGCQWNGNAWVWTNTGSLPIPCGEDYRSDSSGHF